MDALNYNHLLYFWTVAREGSVTAAAEKLLLAQPTISGQLRLLERRLGHQLFRKQGRGLALTDIGQTVYRYADEIFTIGRELADVVSGRPAGGTLRLRVGVADVLPKLVVSRVLRPAFSLRERVRVVCTEGDSRALLAQLSINQLDIVFSDAPIDPHIKVRAYNHLLGECAVDVFAPERQARRFKRGFPASLDGAPFLLPTENTLLRRQLDRWLETAGVRPVVVGEFEDSALIKVLAQLDAGLFVAPSVIRREIERQFGVRAIGRAEHVVEQFYAITMERRFSHPAVDAIVSQARAQLFARG